MKIFRDIKKPQINKQLFLKKIRNLDKKVTKISKFELNSKKGGKIIG